MDLFSGWSSPLVPPKHATTAANGNPLLLLQQQQSMMMSSTSPSSLSPAHRARNATLQFSNQSAVINQSYIDQAGDISDHRHQHQHHQNNISTFSAGSNDYQEKNAWAQNRCLLCLLYEEKLRVLQKKVDDLSHKSGDDEKKLHDEESSEKKKSSEQHHVSHSTIVADPKQFLKIVADKDHEIEELQKDLKHLAIDRDNVRSALDDTQMKLEVAMRMIEELENEKNKKNDVFLGQNINNTKKVSNNRLNQPSVVAAAASSSRSGSAANSRSGTPLPSYSAQDRVNNEMVENVLGLSHFNNGEQQQQKHQNSNNNITLSGVSPVVGSKNKPTIDENEQRVKLSEELSARRHQQATTTTTTNKSSLSAVEKLKLTRNLADESLGMFPSEPHQEVPSSLSRLGPLPHPSSLRSVTLANPSEESWRKGGKKPDLIDRNAKGTPAKNTDTTMRSLRNFMNNSTNNTSQQQHHQQRSMSAVSNSSHHLQVSPPPQTQSSSNTLRDFTYHSPHFQSFGPH